jgi:membrane-associated protease RseP (regulator of RpoE activity)
MNLALTLMLAITATGVSAAAPEPAGQWLDAELAPLLSRLAEDGSLADSRSAPLTLEHAERMRYELGAVVDLRSTDPTGAEVLAVTPGGAAHRVGLRSGDRILAVNGRALADASPDASLEQALLASAGEFRIDLARDARRLSLSGQADRITIPAYSITVSSVGTASGSGCGRINQSLLPPISDEIHPLVIHEIDARLPGPLESTVFQVSEGRRAIKVSEAIRGDRFTGNQNRKRNGLFRYERFRLFFLDVEPDTTYRIGARFIRENREDIRGGSYWEPVVWAEVRERCH